MTTYAVTYTFVVESDDPNPATITEAAEEYVHSVSDAFDNPVSIVNLDT